MTQTKTKKALLMSVLSMVLCVAMLVGMTFAWFTDTASTGVNKIQAGELKIKLLGANDRELSKDTSLTWQKAAGHEAEEVLWEPNCTYNLETFKVRNAGNLAVKYKVILKATDITNKDGKTLLDVLEWKVNGNNVDFKTLGNGIEILADQQLPKGATMTIDVSAHMKAEAGNDYQGLKIDGFGVEVYATQDTVEYDSNGNTYDQDAKFPVIATATNAMDIANAIQSASNQGIPAKITLSDDIRDADLNGGDITVDVADKKLKIKPDNSNHVATINNGSVTITGNDGNKLVNNKIVVDSANASLTIGVGLADSNSYQAMPFEVKNGGTLNITKGNTSNSGSEGIMLKASGADTIANISGGEFKISGSQAKIVEAINNAVVNVSGGTFSASGTGSVVFHANGGTIVISDCNVTYCNGKKVFKEDNGGKIVVTGGKFYVDPSDYVDTNHYRVEKVGIQWVVSKK